MSPAVWVVPLTFAVSTAGYPATLGYPSFHDAHWDPLWAACSDHDVVLSIHLGHQP